MLPRDLGDLRRERGGGGRRGGLEGSGAEEVDSGRVSSESESDDVSPPYDAISASIFCLLIF